VGRNKRKKSTVIAVFNFYRVADQNQYYAALEGFVNFLRKVRLALGLVWI